MNEEPQKAITELFNSALTAKDFLVGELPDYINQLLLWKSTYSALMMFVGIVFIVGAPILLRNAAIERLDLIKKAKAAYEANEPWIRYGSMPTLTSIQYDFCINYGGATPVIKGIISFFMLVMGFCFSNLEWLQIWIAPKVWLVEYAASLVK